jgi:adenylate cyclase
MFADLCGSTKLKHGCSQDEWLPIVVRFLLQVTEIVEGQGGRVLKYIGDEVLAVFDEDRDGLAVSRAVNCIWQCDSRLQKFRPPFVAKYALDYGTAASVTFGVGRNDVLGTCVDRCARIAKLAKDGTAVGSQEVVKRSKDAGIWRKIGSFPFKGFDRRTNVFQLRQFGSAIEVVDAALAARSLGDLASENIRLKAHLAEIKRELRSTMRR